MYTGCIISVMAQLDDDTPFEFIKVEANFTMDADDARKLANSVSADAEKIAGPDYTLHTYIEGKDQISAPGRDTLATHAVPA